MFLTNKKVYNILNTDNTVNTDITEVKYENITKRKNKCL